MDTTTLVIIGLAVFVILLILLFARGGSRRPRVKDLQPLSYKSRDRYLTDPKILEELGRLHRE